MKKLIFLCLFAGLIYFFLLQEKDLPGAVKSERPLNVMQEPIQRDLSGLDSKRYSIGTLKLLAEYDITLRVLDKEYYDGGKKEDSLAPLDLTVGWKRMSDPSVYNRLSIKNSNRRGNYRWSGAPPIPSKEIATSFANMHIIPANRSVRQALDSVNKGDIVRLKGYLVHYKEGDSRSWWQWKSSVSRTDKGDGACELMYVEQVFY